MMREFQVLRELQHKNIVKLQDAYETPSSLILVCELATGGTRRTSNRHPRHPRHERRPRHPRRPRRLRRLLFHRATFCLTGLPRRAPGPLDRRTDAPDRGGA